MKRSLFFLSIFFSFIFISCDGTITEPNDSVSNDKSNDYLPLENGNIWYYSFKSSDNWSRLDGHDSQLMRFKCKFEITNSSLYSDGIEYNVKRSFYSHYEVSSFHSFDSTVNISDTTFLDDSSDWFKIRYNKQDTVEIIDTNPTLMKVNWPPFKRHKGSSAVSDTLQFNYYYFKAGIGYLGFKTAGGFAGAWSTTQLSLDSTKLK